MNFWVVKILLARLSLGSRLKDGVQSVDAISDIIQDTFDPQTFSARQRQYTLITLHWFQVKESGDFSI